MRLETETNNHQRSRRGPRVAGRIAIGGNDAARELVAATGEQGIGHPFPAVSSQVRVGAANGLLPAGVRRG